MAYYFYILISDWCRPFGVIEKNGKPAISVKYRGEKRDFTPEEISAMVLGKMKETAEAYLGKKVTHAVVTVPACALCALLDNIGFLTFRS